jgi:iron complex outermembrane recepter protein
MKKIYLFIIGLFTAVLLHAQTGVVRGKVMDKNTNTALAGANVQITGKSGTVTDSDGVFTLECAGAMEIVISFVGYETLKQSVTDCSVELSVSLNPSTQVLNEVEITATSNQNKLLLSQPVSIAKLGEAEIKRGTGLFLDDAINANIPGVFMQRRTISAGQQFNIRGYGNGVRGTNGASSNFDTQGTKVYLNGIPITDAEGITLLDDIDFGSIGNIEIVKGPAGSLYGLAIAGVVNLKTVGVEKNKTSISQEALVGSYGLKRFTTRLQIGGERSSVSVSYGRQDYDGFMKHTASQKDFVNLVGEFHPSAKQNISTYFGYSNSYDQRNGELTVNQYNSFDYSGNPAYIANDAHSNIISFRAGVTHGYKFNEFLSNTTTVFGSGISSNVSSAGGWTDKLPMNVGIRSTFDLDFKLSNSTRLTGITGVESQRQNAQTIAYAMTDPVSGKNNDPANYLATGVYNYISAQTSNVYAVSKTTSVFTDWTLALPSQLSITAGVGISNMNIELNNRLVTGSNTTPTNRALSKFYGDLISPRFAINKVFLKQISAYFSYSKGYKAPVSSYFYIPLTGQLNSDLKPEVANQFEIGSKGTLLHDRLFYQVAFFSTTFSDKMTVVAVPNATNTATSYTYVANGGEQNHKGAEVLLKYAIVQSNSGFLKSVSPFTNFAYSDFTYGNFKFQQLSGDKKSNVETDYTGKQVAGVPKITYNLGIDAITNLGLYGSINYSYRGETYFVSTNEIPVAAQRPDNSNNEAQAKAFGLLNAKIGFRKTLASHFDLDAYFGLNNITGQQYYQMLFVNQLPDSYLPGPKDINYFGGVILKYIF